MAAEAIINIRVTDQNAGSQLTKLQQSVDSLKRKRNALNKSEKAGSISSREASAQRAKLNLQLKGSQSQLTQLNKKLLIQNKILKKSQGLSGAMTKGFRSMGLALIGTAALIGAISSTVKIFSQFEQQMAEVKAITNATAKEFEQLSKDAIRLGGSTAFTAKEVGSLQVELGKLGFTTKEILNSTEAILNLAAATRSDLAQSATVAGATLRAFNLDASEMTRVTDVMAKSFTSSSLDLEKFQVAMRAVAPVAQSAGVSLEETTSLLGVLTDRGVDASTAGTSLRNVFLELSKQGITFNEAMEQINNAADKNGVALELFGKRGAVAGTILASTAVEAGVLEGKLNDAAGAAKEMADIQLATLIGKTTIMKSAWEGMILSLEDGEGAISSALKNVVEFATEVLKSITDINKTTQEITDEVGQKTVDGLKSQIDENIKLRRKEADIEILKSQSLVDRKLRLEEQHNTEKKRIEKEFTDFQANETKRALKTQIAILEESIPKLSELNKSTSPTEDLPTFARKSRLLVEAKKSELKILRGLLETELEKKKEDTNKLLQDEIIENKRRDEAGKKAAKEAKKLREKETAELLLLAEAESTRKSEALFRDFAEKQALAKSEFELLQEKARLEFELLTTSEEQKKEFELLQQQETRQNEISLAQEKLEFETEVNDLTIAEERRLQNEITKLQIEGDIQRTKSTKESAKEDKKTQEDLTSAKIQIAKSGLAGLRGVATEGSALSKGVLVAEKALAITAGALALKAGLAKSAGAPFPANLILISGFIASTVGLLASIKNVVIPPAKKFARGGQIAGGGVLQGASHQQGGIPIPLNEFEGGEAVITANAVRLFEPLLSAINQIGGGVSFSNETLDTGTPQPEQQQQLTRAFVVESDITETQERLSIIKERSEIF